MMLTSELEYTYNGQGRVYLEQYTLAELNVKPGDVVECVADAGLRNYVKGKQYTINSDGETIQEDGIAYNGSLSKFRIISRASDRTEGYQPSEEELSRAAYAKGIDYATPSPVRTVTRTEIVPGVYGIVDLAGVDKDMVQIRLQSTAALKTWFTASDLTAAIQTLTQILGAMEDKQ